MSETSDGRLYPCNQCSDTDPDKYAICTETPDDNCPKYRIWIGNVNKEQYPGKMCPHFCTCFLSAYVGSCAPSWVDCTGTYAAYEERGCINDEEEGEEETDDE